MPRGIKKVVQHPATKELWRESFRNFSMKIGFTLSLSKTMLEYLCAVADDAQWDRSLYWSNGHWPDNWLASQRSLEKRGLIQRKPEDAINEKMQQAFRGEREGEKWYEWNHYELTPAGECIVTLLKIAGMFVEADAAINKKHRTA